MPEQEGQGILFDGSPEGQPTPAPEDIDAVARRIAESAGTRDVTGAYNRPVSEAAEDQGWGSVTRSQAQHTETGVVGSPRLFELPGKDGRNNWYNRSPTFREVQRGMATEDIDDQRGINQAGAAEGLDVLDGKTPPPSI